ncbi:hypothetical protein HK096_005316 [Nowakowskiella sp. JEL0078]|nr:hypothetical protein HK096_005316 [Nowakowskiella sp. JEL0078]
MANSISHSNDSLSRLSASHLDLISPARNIATGDSASLDPKNLTIAANSSLRRLSGNKSPLRIQIPGRTPLANVNTNNSRKNESQIQLHDNDELNVHTCGLEPVSNLERNHILPSLTSDNPSSTPTKPTEPNKSTPNQPIQHSLNNFTSTTQTNIDQNLILKSYDQLDNVKPSNASNSTITSLPIPPFRSNSIVRKHTLKSINKSNTCISPTLEIGIVNTEIVRTPTSPTIKLENNYSSTFFIGAKRPQTPTQSDSQRLEDNHKKKLSRKCSWDMLKAGVKINRTKSLRELFSRTFSKSKPNTPVSPSPISPTSVCLTRRNTSIEARRVVLLEESDLALPRSRSMKSKISIPIFNRTRCSSRCSSRASFRSPIAEEPENDVLSSTEATQMRSKPKESGTFLRENGSTSIDAESIVSRIGKTLNSRTPRPRTASDDSDLISGGGLFRQQKILNKKSNDDLIISEDSTDWSEFQGQHTANSNGVAPFQYSGCNSPEPWANQKNINKPLPTPPKPLLEPPTQTLSLDRSNSSQKRRKKYEKIRLALLQTNFDSDSDSEDDLSGSPTTLLMMRTPSQPRTPASATTAANSPLSSLRPLSSILEEKRRSMDRFSPTRSAVIAFSDLKETLKCVSETSLVSSNESWGERFGEEVDVAEESVESLADIGNTQEHILNFVCSEKFTDIVSLDRDFKRKETIIGAQLVDARRLKSASTPILSFISGPEFAHVSIALSVLEKDEHWL